MGTMRIIAGKYRGKALKTPTGQETRPLLSRLRKSLVDILRPRLAGARVLELFGGSGAVSFELLSGGAKEALIIELSPHSARAIRENAAALGADARVMEGDCLKALPRIFAAGERFDIVIVAPPYGKNLQHESMELLTQNFLLAEGGLVIVQREGAEPFWEAKAPFVHLRTREYGRTVFDFYKEE